MQILLGQHRFALASLHSKEKKTEIKKKKKPPPTTKKTPKPSEKEREKRVSTLHIPELLHAHYLTYLFTQSLSLMHFFLNTDTYSSTPELQFFGLM